MTDVMTAGDAVAGDATLFNTTGMAARIRARIMNLPANADYASFRASGLLFHGTCEPLEGALRPGSYDRVFWTAETPSIAQAYIPEAGLSMILSHPGDWRLEERIRPNLHDPWAELMHQMGHWPREVDHDHCGQATSWTISADHPTYGAALLFLQSLGYDIAQRSIWAALKLNGNRQEIRPAAWKQPGFVYVTLNEGLSFRDMRDELMSDLVDPAHVKLDLFRAVEESGSDGIVIDDFAQCGRDHANVGHVSFGLFAEAAKTRAFVRFPATHCDFQGLKTGSTPEFEAFRLAI